MTSAHRKRFVTNPRDDHNIHVDENFASISFIDSQMVSCRPMIILPIPYEYKYVGGRNCIGFRAN